LIFPSVACSPHELARTGPPTFEVLTLLALSQKCTLAAQHRAGLRTTAEDEEDEKDGEDGEDGEDEVAVEDAFETKALAVLTSLRSGQRR
tara:strand:- start:3257 stop:3526 length:270 start_codon:yes stop_codon:yes gene_type:complete